MFYGHLWRSIFGRKNCVSVYLFMWQRLALLVVHINVRCANCQPLLVRIVQVRKIVLSCCRKIVHSNLHHSSYTFCDGWFGAQCPKMIYDNFLIGKLRNWFVKWIPNFSLSIKFARQLIKYSNCVIKVRFLHYFHRFARDFAQQLLMKSTDKSQEVKKHKRIKSPVESVPIGQIERNFLFHCLIRLFSGTFIVVVEGVNFMRAEIGGQLCATQVAQSVIRI